MSSLAVGLPHAVVINTININSAAIKDKRFISFFSAI